MKISYAWLQDYFDKKLPAPEKIAELLTMHAFEVEDIEKVGTDRVLDVKILPDRSHDCLSYIGIAREVALVTGVPLKESVLSPKVLNVPESNLLKVEIEDAKLCKRFSALVIEHIEVGPSPVWLKERLETIGQKSINNVVDATNYVMFALGQPLHAYDRELLIENGGGWKLVVRKAYQEESLIALDNKEYTLSDELVIADGNADKALGLAGIKGGKASEITSKTKNIILESANFEPVNIRKTAKKLGLRTDASVRFENEITPELTTMALKMVADLIVNIAGTDETQVEGLVDIFADKKQQYTLGVSAKEVNDYLGSHYTEEDVEKVMKGFGWEYEKVIPKDRLQQLIPTILGKPYFRLARNLYDAPEKFSCGSLVNWLLKECGYPTPRVALDMYFYSRHITKDELAFGDFVFTNSLIQIPKDKMIYSQVLGKDVPDVPVYTKTLEYLPGLEFPQGIDHVGIYMGDGKVLHTSSQIGHVVIEDLATSEIFKNECWYGRMIEDIHEPQFVVRVPFERLDLRIKPDLIEEVGRAMGYENLVAKPITPWQGNVEIEKKDYYSNLLRILFVEHGFSEVITYVFCTKGEIELANPIAKDRSYLRANLADGMNEALKLNNHNTDLLGLSEVKIFEIGNVFKDSGEHLMLAFTAKQADEIQKLVSLALGVELQFEKNSDVYEAHIGKVIHDLPEPPERTLYISVGEQVNVTEKLQFTPFSKYPFVRRDIALWVPANSSDKAKSKLGIIFDNRAGDLLRNSSLFDQFQKEEKTSLAFHLVFQSFEKTLTDEEVNAIMEKITNDITDNGWQVR